MAYLPVDLNTRTTLLNSEVMQDFTALDNLVSGNLTQANFSTATAIPNTLLATSNVEEVLTLRWGGPTGTAMAVSATEPIDCIPLPGSSTYTIVRASYTYFSGGAAGTAGSISVNLGTVAGGNFTSTSTLINSVALTNNTAANNTVTGNLAIATSTFTTATTPTQLALVCTGSSATTTPRLVVTLVVTRSLQ